MTTQAEMRQRDWTILFALRKNGIRPSTRELANMTGVAKSTLYYDTLALKRRGLIKGVPRQARTLTLTGKGLLASQGYELIYTCDEEGIHAA